MNVKHILVFVLCLSILFCLCTTTAFSESENDPENKAPAVFFTDDISPEGLIAVYEALDWQPDG